MIGILYGISGSVYTYLKIGVFGFVLLIFYHYSEWIVNENTCLETCSPIYPISCSVAYEGDRFYFKPFPSFNSSCILYKCQMFQLEKQIEISFWILKKWHTQNLQSNSSIQESKIVNRPWYRFHSKCTFFWNFTNFHICLGDCWKEHIIVFSFICLISLYAGVMLFPLYDFISKLQHLSHLEYQILLINRINQSLQ